MSQCCLSVRPSVVFRYRDHIGWNTSKIISQLIILRFVLGLIWFKGELVQRQHPRNYGRIGMGSGAQKLAISPKRYKIGPRLL